MDLYDYQAQLILLSAKKCRVKSTWRKMKISFSFSAVIWHKFGRGVGLRLRECEKKQWVCTGYVSSILLYV
jgi:hypothetical protein